MNTKRITNIALLSAAALIIFIIEAQIPVLVPIPGVKLGLANVITLVSIYILSKRDTFCILLIRIVLGSIFSGQIMAFFYSLAGGLLCFAVISLMSCVLTKKQVLVISIAGALAHNAGQLAVAAFVLNSTKILVYAPFLLLSGIITGAFTGLCAQLLVNRFSCK